LVTKGILGRVAPSKKGGDFWIAVEDLKKGGERKKKPLSISRRIVGALLGHCFRPKGGKLERGETQVPSAKRTEIPSQTTRRGGTLSFLETARRRPFGSLLLKEMKERGGRGGVRATGLSEKMGGEKRDDARRLSEGYIS